MDRRAFRKTLITLILSSIAASSARPSTPDPLYDIVIYGGTSAGISAALEAKRLGKTAVVIEPGHRIGGLTTGGLGWTDIGNKTAIGGIAHEFYQGIKKYYEEPGAWKWQRREDYRHAGQGLPASDQGDAAMWVFEPSAALAVFEGWVRENGLQVVYGERLDRHGGVATDGAAPPRIVSIRMESGRVFRGRMFIDAGYEGDLLAAAHVDYTVGREANSRYGETLDGIQTARATHHNLHALVDPYLVPGDATSGLLPFIDRDGPGEEGAGDGRVQAYCFRMCLTDRKENRIPFQKPEGYDETWYELLFRNFEAGDAHVPWINSPLPNGKSDTNNGGGFSTDFIGQNYAYPEASYAERERIAARHVLYQKGLLWTLANHPRVPAAIRAQVAAWGLCKDEFVENGGWPGQLYIREARRLVGETVMTQNHCEGREKAGTPVGLAAYTMDSHNVQRYVNAKGEVRNEGNVEVGGFSPYPIDYGALLPRASQCANLLVPVCLSASHIAYGSIRMEPVFMVLGQSAAAAAALALDEDVPVQQVDRARLCERLLAEGQVLSWTPVK